MDRCKDCGIKISWSGKGRWPKYCFDCRAKRQRPYREAALKKKGENTDEQIPPAQELEAE